MAIISGSRVFKAAAIGALIYRRWTLTLDWDNELWNDWKYLGSTLFEHIENSLYRQESVWVLLLSDSFEEDWQVVMVIELGHINFPLDLVLWAMLNADWKISSVVETTELTGLNFSWSSSSSSWLLWSWLLLWLQEGGGLSSNSHTLLKDTCWDNDKSGLVRIWKLSALQIFIRRYICLFCQN